jgi:glycosyltransferase involved in cell wall biosynthesis
MFKKLVAPRTEEEIIRHWKYKDKTYISVICITYNQDIYIRDAIDSFLAQITEYKFEIIIHDDVSTDSTIGILKRYQQKYPSIIKLILQTTNQFSININLPFKNTIAIAKGEYLALCEGDDFWSSEKKLSLQVNELNLHKSMNLCFHPSVHLSENNMRLGPKYTRGQQITCAELIVSDFHLCASASMMFRKSVFADLSFLNGMSIGDFYLRIIAAQNGAIYINKEMCIYRVNSQGSWSESNHNDVQKITSSISSFYNELKVFDVYLNSRYQEEFSILKLRLLTGFIRKANIPASYRTNIYNLDERLPIKVKVLWRLIYSRSFYQRLYLFGRYIKYIFKKRKVA